MSEGGLRTILAQAGLGSAPPRQIGAIAEDGMDEPLVFMTPNGTGSILEMPPKATIDFDIAERAAAGVAVGLAQGGFDVILNFGTLNHSLHAMDVLCVPVREPGASGVFYFGSVGPGMNLGFQHEFWSLELLASTAADRVLVPYAKRQVIELARRWRSTNETWVVAVPLQVAVESPGAWSQLRSCPAANLDGRTNVFCLGSAVLKTFQALGHIRDLNIVPVFDLRDPFSEIAPEVLDLAALVVVEDDVGDQLVRLLTSRLGRPVRELSVERLSGYQVA